VFGKSPSTKETVTMHEQGRITLPTGEDGRVLGRLADLGKVVPPSLVRQVPQATVRVNGRACELLIELYHERWEEFVFDEQKTHQDPRRAEKPAQVRSETPEGVRQELHALSLGHFVIRSMMFEAARAVELDVDRLSFCGCFRILQCRMPECNSHTPTTLTEWYQALLAEMQAEQIEARRNRINPCVIKRKMSKWGKKQAEHRHPPPLRKTFAQCVVMKT
jgi:hypothetical protein